MDNLKIIPFSEKYHFIKEKQLTIRLHEHGLMRLIPISVTEELINSTNKIIFHALLNSSVYKEMFFDHYSQKISAQRFADLRNIEDGRAAIEKTFRDTAKTGCAEGRHKGCLMVNSGMELAPHDPETAAIAHQAFRRAEDTFAAALKRAIDQGTISKTKNVRALARFLTGSFQGVQLMSRRGADQETLQDYTDTILAALD